MCKMSTCLRIGGLAAALLLAAPGCGGGDPSTLQVPGAGAGGPVDPARSGTLTVQLVPDGLPGPMSGLNLALAALELRVDGDWRPVPLTLPGATADILGAAPGAPLVLATQVPWPEGGIDAMRFTLGSGSTVRLAADDTEHSLAAPPVLMAGMGLPGSLRVAAQEDAGLWITFSVTQVAAPDPLDPENYLFVPGPVRGYDKAATGSLSGAVTGPAGPLAGAVVSAQLQRLEGEPSDAIAFRTAQTDGEGHYSLDLLPKGYTWCVVSQPVLEAAYYPRTSPGFALGSAPFDAYEATLACAPAPFPGKVSGTLAEKASPGHWAVVDLVQEIPSAGVPFRYELRSAAVEEDFEGLRSFSIPSVPPGIYAAVLNDYSLDPDLGRVGRSQATARFVVAAGGHVVLAF